MADQAEAIVPDQVGDVVRMPRDEVVHADDGVAIGEKAIGQVRPEETGGTGDEDPHRVLTRCPARSSGM